MRELYACLYDVLCNGKSFGNNLIPLLKKEFPFLNNIEGNIDYFKTILRRLCLTCRVNNFRFFLILDEYQNKVVIVTKCEELTKEIKNTNTFHEEFGLMVSSLPQDWNNRTELNKFLYILYYLYPEIQISLNERKVFLNLICDEFPFFQGFGIEGMSITRVVRIKSETHTDVIQLKDSEVFMNGVIKLCFDNRGVSFETDIPEILQAKTVFEILK